jgi:hypothetical protein
VRQVRGRRIGKFRQGGIEVSRDPVGIGGSARQWTLNDIGGAIDHPCQVKSGAGAVLVDAPEGEV